MTRYWFMTSTFYGNWLPGDARGSVSGRHFLDDDKIINNQFGDAYDSSMPNLEAFSRKQMKGPPVQLNLDQARLVMRQFHETTAVRGWHMRAAAIMNNHMHWLVAAAEADLAATILRDYKAYASRKLTQCSGRPASGPWWTEGGSTRLLPDEAALARVTEYVAAQKNPLVVWVAGEWLVGGEGDGR